jgi:hypothetical protein
VLNLGVDAKGAFFHVMESKGDINHRTITQWLARLGDAPVAVYDQGETIPQAVGVFGSRTDACAIVSTSSTSYVQCLGAAQTSTGLGQIATSSSFFAPDRIFAAAQGDGTVFFMQGKYAAIAAVSMSSAGFQYVSLAESSVSYPGGAVPVSGFGYACAITNDGAVGIATSGGVSSRSRDGVSYGDCRIATDGTKLHVVGSNASELRYAVVVALDPSTGASGPVNLAALADADPSSSYAVVWFGGKPGLIQRGADGAIALRNLSVDGSLGSARVLISGSDGWDGLATVGPDGGLHLAYIAGSNQYVKLCP